MLTFTKLVARNLVYHARGNLAVMLGVAVGSAVLTGALLVGDSLRGSLRERVERQLDGIDAVAFFTRPVRADIADGLPGKVAPVLLLPGSAQAVAGDDATAPYLGHVTVLGVDDRFKPGGVSGVDWNSAERKAVLSHRVAEKLRVKSGDRVRIGVERFSEIPRATLLAKRSLDASSATLAFTVVAVLPHDAPENDFNLTPNPAAPLNVFVPLKTLSDLVQNEQGESKTFPPKATALFASGGTVEELNTGLRGKISLEDYGLKVRVPRQRKAYVSVETDQLLLDEPTATAVQTAADKLTPKLHAERTMVYLVNGITRGGAEIPYSVVAAINPAVDAPLGPFRTTKGHLVGDNEIVLLDWDESPLKGLDDSGKVMLTLTYFNPEVEGEGKIETAELTFRGYVPFRDAAADRDLTPPVKGMTDEKANIFDWNRPPQLDNKKVKEKIKPGDRNERYWNKHRATPKAYVNLTTGRRLFGSRYGSVTSIRVAPAPNESPEQAAERLKPALLKELDPASGGFVFDPIRNRLLTASKGGTDFGGLFLGFSCFLIAAALMLVGLLFRLSLDRRAKEIGLLLAAGFAVRQVRRLLLAEGLIVAVVGAAVGLVAGIAYNRLLLLVLLDLWPDEGVKAYFKPHATPMSFALGFGMTVAMAFAALWWSVRGLVKVAPPALLRGETAVASIAVKGPSRWTKILAVASLVVGIALLLIGGSVDNPDYRAMTFFGGGGLLLTAALTGAWVWMRRTRHRAVSGRGVPALTQLGTRNAARNPTRSLLTAALLASAAFLLVAVESFRRQPDKEFLEITGGSGGFNLIGEVDVAINNPFDSGPGKNDLDVRLQEAYGRSDTDPRYLAAVESLEGIEVHALRLRGGDDASCMNLFQAARPRVLGVPDSIIARGGFKFYETLAKTPEEKANPWLLLRERGIERASGGAVPAFCEQNTAQWMLKKGVGDTFTMPGDDGNEVTFRIVGTLVDSPFQSELITSDAEFARAFPKQTGYRAFLIRTPPEKEAAVSRVLETGLRANGLVVTSARERVASFQAVIGAYLSTFQLLGGFGLLLGVLGLAVVVLRGVWERLGELALLRAVGYRTRSLQFLVLVENALLLLVGLGSGVLAALASVAPHVASGAAIPWLRLAGMLGLVLVVGFVVASAATAGILRVPVIPALRRE